MRFGVLGAGALSLLTSTIRSIKGAVDRGKPISVVPGFLRPIDTDALAKDLDLHAEGTRRGGQNKPSQSNQQLDAVEQQIVQRVSSEWTWQGNELINQLRAYLERLLQCSISVLATNLRGEANNAKTQLQTADVMAASELGPLREKFISARQDLAAFRSKHSLERAVINPARRWTAFGLLIFLIAVESGLNGIFFAEGATFGLIGGVGTAISISVANVVAAFLIGLGPARFINYRNFLVRVFAAMFTLIGIGALVLLHAFAAKFRDATAAVGEERAFEVAVQRMLETPWAVDDISSIYLFGLGVLFAIGAFWKGYRFDDPYPFYGATYRRMEHARDEYSDEHQELFGELEEVKERAIQNLKDGIQRIPLLQGTEAQILTQREAVVAKFRAYEDGVETATNQLLQVYRDANEAARKEPIPGHFNDRWNLPQRFCDSAEVEKLCARPNDPSPIDPDELKEELERYTDEVLSTYSTLLTKHPISSDL